MEEEKEGGGGDLEEEEGEGLEGAQCHPNFLTCTS